jgi:hypothetical protein
MCKCGAKGVSKSYSGASEKATHKNFVSPKNIRRNTNKKAVQFNRTIRYVQNGISHIFRKDAQHKLTEALIADIINKNDLSVLSYVVNEEK